MTTKTTHGFVSEAVFLSQTLPHLVILSESSGESSAVEKKRRRASLTPRLRSVPSLQPFVFSNGTFLHNTQEEKGGLVWAQDGTGFNESNGMTLKV